MKMVLNSTHHRPTFVGLNYASCGVQVCVIDHSGSVKMNQNCRNDWREIVRAASRFGPVSRAAIESCSTMTVNGSERLAMWQ
jgi:hypothetical protein